MLLNLCRSALLFLLFLVSACMPVARPTPLLTDTPIPATITTTPTIVWFPPTTTFTPFPTALPFTPTPDQRPGIGEVLLRDDFTGGEAWMLTTTQAGSVAYGKAELTIAISEERAYLYSIREIPVFTDFYLEITANPNLCQGKDEYGLLLRVSPSLDFYRYSLSCDGHVRLDRVYRSQASSPQPWVLSGAVPPGAPSTSRLGVWAVGEEMRFFVNDEYVFTVSDPLIPGGVLGVFARATGEMAVTVNYSDLIVYAVEQ